MELNGPAGVAPEALRRVALGVGARRGATGAEVLRLTAEALALAGLDRSAVAVLATLDGKTAEPGLVEAARELGVPLVGHPAALLAAQGAPRHSAAALAAVGTPSVAEAAALASAAGGALLVPRLSAPTCTVALAGPVPEHRTTPGADT